MQPVNILKPFLDEFFKGYIFMSDLFSGAFPWVAIGIAIAVIIA